MTASFEAFYVSTDEFMFPDVGTWMEDAMEREIREENRSLLDIAPATVGWHHSTVKTRKVGINMWDVRVQRSAKARPFVANDVPKEAIALWIELGYFVEVIG